MAGTGTGWGTGWRKLLATRTTEGRGEAGSGQAGRERARGQGGAETEDGTRTEPREEQALRHPDTERWTWSTALS